MSRNNTPSDFELSQLAAQHLTPQDARIYELHLWEAGPRLTVYTLAPKVNLKPRQVFNRLRAIRDTLREIVAAMPYVETSVVDGLTEEQMGIDCRMTLQFGHEAKTRVDTVAQGVLRALHRRDAA